METRTLSLESSSKPVLHQKIGSISESCRRTSTGGSRQRVYSNMALLEEIDEADNTGPWYFDSGCSRHMTGVKENLQEVKKLKGGKVTFGCGTKGNDSRQGTHL
ncbi:unnamed protein product [Microthlaspi erraticum]|uniref:Retrovirus-related Pol polyprotein from transposon TNT 1-94-like beta-barrel domain-containing protein n=1 Tax=Microthlaspi erraticum TaxID=1685480 RepID=A0A6D2IBS9_9BRAS|nr:unnamed protein product [Microthlaspi erraticum]